MSSKDLAISARGLSKSYTIAHNAAKSTSLHQALRGRLKTPRQRASKETFWALKDVSFDIHKGDVVGVIGRNGAGKSTLLKLLSRITEPNTGRIEMYGRVGSLLEVGTGFHPELTGRENIYLNGAILGMRRREISQNFDAIVDFAGVEKFLDTPVKRYSSGMYVRLAFAVAAHLQPEILIVDEVLAVGDSAFQKKCLGKMQDVAKQGRTVLFVSHNMGSVRQLCSRGIWMKGGQVAVDGGIDECIAQYLSSLHQGVSIDSGSLREDQLHLTRVVFKNGSGELTTNFRPGDDLVVEVHYHAPRRFYHPHFWLGISSQHGSLCGANMLFDGHVPEYVEGEGVLSCVFKSLPLLPQDFTVNMGVRADDGITILLPTQDVGMFSVVGRMSDYGFFGQLADALGGNSAPVVLPYEWRHPNGDRFPVDGVTKKGCLL